MLVQECDLSHAGVNSCGAVEAGGANDSDRLSVQSLGNNQTFLKRNQVTSHQINTSPITRQYNLRKVNYKSKVNMKSFLLNKNKGNYNDRKLETPSR